MEQSRWKQGAHYFYRKVAGGGSGVVGMRNVYLSNPHKPFCNIRVGLDETRSPQTVIKNSSHPSLLHRICCGPPPSVCSRPSASSAPPLAPPAASAGAAAPPTMREDVKSSFCNSHHFLCESDFGRRLESIQSRFVGFRFCLFCF